MANQITRTNIRTHKLKQQQTHTQNKTLHKQTKTIKENHIQEYMCCLQYMIKIVTHEKTNIS